MKFLTTLVAAAVSAALVSAVATIESVASSAAAAVVDGGIASSSAGKKNVASAPTNNLPNPGHDRGRHPKNNASGGSGGGGSGKPSASQHRAGRSRRMAERRARARDAIDASELRPMSPDDLEKAYLAAEESARRRGLGEDEKEDTAFLRKAQRDLEEANERKRKLWGNGGNADPYEPAGGLVEETAYYDKWQQAYRFLGGYIDCTHSWGGNSHDSGDGDSGSGQVCSRWMIWAAYIDPNYAGGGYDEYYGDDAPGSLDCHSPDTDWKLIGVYRQEFYQYIEQISKHLWAVDEYEYIVALAGLKYMTKYECFGVGYDENGNQLYAGVQPLEGGAFQMGLYSDAQCIQLNTQTAYTYDDFAEQSELNLGSRDQTDDDAFRNTAYQYWLDTQEYTLTNLNNVYNDFKFCTSCIDYPTYQDGYFIGDDGTDDDDLINQCWKFYSHDSFNCDADCIAMGANQGTITWLQYNGKQFGTLIDGQYAGQHDKSSRAESSAGGSSSATSGGAAQRVERLKANLFLTFAGVVFVATFLAFAVARGSSKKKVSRSSRGRRLLDADYGGEDRTARSSSRKASGRSSGRSQSRSGGGGGERSVRSSRSKSKSRSGSKSVKSSSRSKSRTRESAGYEPPSSEQKSRSQSHSRKTSSSRRERGDD